MERLSAADNGAVIVVDGTVNFIKYKKQSAGALSGVTRYVSQEEKIRDMDSRQLVSGQNCTPQLADREFQATRDACRKDSPVWFYHYVQSFSPDEVITGEQAHQLYTAVRPLY